MSSISPGGQDRTTPAGHPGRAAGELPPTPSPVRGTPPAARAVVPRKGLSGPERLDWVNRMSLVHMLMGSGT